MENGVIHRVEIGDLGASQPWEKNAHKSSLSRMIYATNICEVREKMHHGMAIRIMFNEE
jgi:hypothetical protein